MKKYIIFAALVVAAAIAWKLLKPHPEPGAGDVKPVAQVQIAALKDGPIVESLATFGVVEAAPSGSLALTLAYDTMVVRVATSQGATVARGDLVMEVEPTPDARLAVESARGAAKVATQLLAAMRQRFDLKLATSQDLYAAEQAAADATLRLSSLESRGQSGNGRVLSVATGVVTKLEAQPGTVIPAGVALATIAGVDTLEGHFAVEVADVQRLKVGQTVDVAPADRPDATLATGSVRQVGSFVDAASGSVDIRVTLPGGGGWFAGERIQGSVHVKEKTALVAPRSAVLSDEAVKVLYTIKDNKASKHTVRTGVETSDSVEVIGDDLHAGDKVVVVGNYELEDGMDVQVVSGGAEAGPAPGNAGKTP